MSGQLSARAAGTVQTRYRRDTVDLTPRAIAGASRVFSLLLELLLYRAFKNIENLIRQQPHPEQRPVGHTNICSVGDRTRDTQRNSSSLNHRASRVGKYILILRSSQKSLKLNFVFAILQVDHNSTFPFKLKNTLYTYAISKQMIFTKPVYQANRSSQFSLYTKKIQH